MKAILDSAGRPLPTSSRRRQVAAKYDAAQTTPGNAKHWSNADGLSALSANSPSVRRTLRNRARYEVANNSYASGIVQTLANDLVGTGPRLQLLTDNHDLNRTLEREFFAWSQAVRLARKLRTMRQARAVDGEAFGVMTTNPHHVHPVLLDVQLIEADQVASNEYIDKKNTADGIEFDSFGNPIRYNILDEHPGDWMSFAGSSTPHSADVVLHWFREDRPGQRRGIPDLTPALPLFAQLRRFTLAVIRAAELAAEWTLFLKTNSPAYDDDGGQMGPAEIEQGAFWPFEFDYGMMTTLAEGWEPFQLKAEQPASTYEMFKREILNEIARCMNMPYNIAAGNSSGYNYASGRLDHQTYFKSIRIDQSDMETAILDRILNVWLKEASYTFDDVELPVSVPHQWFWDGMEHVDPAKEAKAQATRLDSNTTTLAVEYARQGKDWEDELRQRGKEIALMKNLGLSLPSGVRSNEEDDDEEK